MWPTSVGLAGRSGSADPAGWMASTFGFQIRVGFSRRVGGFQRVDDTVPSSSSSRRAPRRGRDGRRAVALDIARRLVGVELVEVVDDATRLGQLVGIDLAAPHEVEDDLAELGERLLAAARRSQIGAQIVEPGATLARAALEHLAHDAGLLEGGAQQRAEGAA